MNTRTPLIASALLAASIIFSASALADTLWNTNPDFQVLVFDSAGLLANAETTVSGNIVSIDSNQTGQNLFYPNTVIASFAIIANKPIESITARMTGQIRIQASDIWSFVSGGIRFDAVSPATTLDKGKELVLGTFAQANVWEEVIATFDVTNTLQIPWPNPNYGLDCCGFMASDWTPNGWESYGLSLPDPLAQNSFVIDVMPQSWDSWGEWQIDLQHIELVITPVPEPETYAMMLAGLGLVGAAARRRRGVM